MAAAASFPSTYWAVFWVATDLSPSPIPCQFPTVGDTEADILLVVAATRAAYLAMVAAPMVAALAEATPTAADIMAKLISCGIPQVLFANVFEISL